MNGTFLLKENHGLNHCVYGTIHMGVGVAKHFPSRNYWLVFHVLVLLHFVYLEYLEPLSVTNMQK